MPRWRPDQTLYPSPKMAMQAPLETTAFVGMLDPTRTTPDALAVVDGEPASRTYGQILGRVDMVARAFMPTPLHGPSVFPAAGQLKAAGITELS